MRKLGKVAEFILKNCIIKLKNCIVNWKEFTVDNTNPGW